MNIFNRFPNIQHVFIPFSFRYESDLKLPFRYVFQETQVFRLNAFETLFFTANLFGQFTTSIS